MVNLTFGCTVVSLATLILFVELPHSFGVSSPAPNQNQQSQSPSNGPSLSSIVASRTCAARGRGARG
jgi:hypothetical protein